MMDLEQDAMLTAIGQMSMEQAREKWADRWSEFVQSMTRWKSVHTLLRLARLNAEQRKLAMLITDLEAREKRLLALQEISWQIQDDIDMAGEQLYELARMRDDAEDAKEAAKPSQPPATFFDLPYDDEHYENIYPPPLHRGKHEREKTKKGYSWKIAAAIEAAFLTRAYEEAGGDAELERLSKASTENSRISNNYTKSIEKANSDIEEARVEKLKLQDEYDITKPYAMGLLVADIFKSLAMAIEGEIY